MPKRDRLFTNWKQAATVTGYPSDKAADLSAKFAQIRATHGSRALAASDPDQVLTPLERITVIVWLYTVYGGRGRDRQTDIINRRNELAKQGNKLLLELRPHCQNDALARICKHLQVKLAANDGGPEDTMSWFTRVSGRQVLGQMLRPLVKQ